MAFASVIQLTETTLVLRGIFTLPEHRRQGHAVRLLRGFAAMFPGRVLSFPVLLPEAAAPGFFDALGFRRGAVSQFEMQIEP